VPQEQAAPNGGGDAGTGRRHAAAGAA
jgi:hypothetical protein